MVAGLVLVWGKQACTADSTAAALLLFLVTGDVVSKLQAATFAA